MNIDDIIEVARLKGRVIALEAEVERLRSSSFVTAVPSEEYEKLKAENSLLKAAVESHERVDCLAVERLKAEVERLKAEPERLMFLLNNAYLANERLRKAGDAMADLLSCAGSPPNVVQSWNAAKEGKQS